MEVCTAAVPTSQGPRGLVSKVLARINLLRALPTPFLPQLLKLSSYPKGFNDTTRNPKTLNPETLKSLKP